MQAAFGFLKNSLADSAAFRTLVGATEGDEAAKKAAAAAKVWQLAVDDDVERPYAMLTYGAGENHERVATGSSDKFDCSGSIELWLETARTDGEKVQISLAAFMAQVEPIIADLKALSGRGGYLAIESITRDEPPMIEPKDSEDKYCMVKYNVNWK